MNAILHGLEGVAQSGATLLSSFVLTTREDKTRSVIAVVIVIAACASIFMPQITDSARWIQSIAVLIVGYYFGVSAERSRAIDKEDRNGRNKKLS